MSNTMSIAVLVATAVLLLPSRASARLRDVLRTAPSVRPRSAVGVMRLRLPRRTSSHGDAVGDSPGCSAADTAFLADLLGACLIAGLPVPTAVSPIHG